MYAEDRERRRFQATAPSYEQFLQELQLVVNIERLQPQFLDRAAQLCQRTNQFNLTTRRHTAADLQRFAASPDAIVLLMNVRDRFGDYGWTGLAIAQRRGTRAEIDSFMVSCRVLGKRVEFALFAAVVEWARRAQCEEVAGLYIPTVKNLICVEFYQQCGLASDGRAPRTFVAGLARFKLPDIHHIQLVTTFY
jgi:FkbH-like protein